MLGSARPAAAGAAHCEAATAARPTNALVFVQIPTHFREMIRVAELLQDAPGYRPTVVFMTEYAGVAQDVERCTARGIGVLTPPDFRHYLRTARPGALARALHAVRSALVAPRRALIAAATAFSRGGRTLARFLARPVWIPAWNPAWNRTWNPAWSALWRPRWHTGWRPHSRLLASLAVRMRYARLLTWWAFHEVVRVSPRWLRRAGAALRDSALGDAARAAPRGVRAAIRVAVLVTLRLPWRALRAVAGRGDTKVAEAARAAFRGVRAVIRIAVLVTLRLPWRALRAVAGRGDTAIAEAARAVIRMVVFMVRLPWRGIATGAATARRWTGSTTRALLQHPVPRLEEMRWLRALPPWARGAVLWIARALLGLMGAIVLPLRYPARMLLVWGFGYAYRHHPESLPPDIRAQHYLWGIVDRMLAANDVDLLVLPEDNFYYFTNLFIKAAHARNAAVVIVPFTVVNTLEWSEAFYRLPSHDAQIVVNWFIAKLFPRWRHEHKGRRLVMPVQQVLANEYLRIAPPIPWLINSGAADAIAVESTFMHRYYSQAGIPGRQLQLVGGIADDVLHRFVAEADVRRKALNARLGFAFDRPLIVCALPPNQLAGDGRATCSIQDYREILRCFVDPLERVADRYNVVVSLHPRIVENDARVLEGRNLRVAPDNIAELVPLARIYVACSSATIRLANACAVPTVNFDIYRYGYGDFKDVPGVITIEETVDYFEVVERLTGSAEEYARIQRSQAEFVSQEMLFDGNAGRRTLALFDRVVAERRRASP